MKIQVCILLCKLKLFLRGERKIKLDHLSQKVDASGIKLVLVYPFIFLYTFLIGAYFTFTRLCEIVCIVTGENVENCNDERILRKKMMGLIGVETRGKKGK